MIPYVIAEIKTRFAAVTGLAALVPGSIHFQQAIGETSPYAVCKVTGSPALTISEKVGHFDYLITVGVCVDSNNKTLDLQAIYDKLVQLPVGWTAALKTSPSDGELVHIWPKESGLDVKPLRRQSSDIVGLQLSWLLRLRQSIP